MATMANFARLGSHIWPIGCQQHASGLHWHADGHEYVQTERRRSFMIAWERSKFNESKTVQDVCSRSIHDGVGPSDADGDEFV